MIFRREAYCARVFVVALTTPPTCVSEIFSKQPRIFGCCSNARGGVYQLLANSEGQNDVATPSNGGERVQCTRSSHIVRRFLCNRLRGFRERTVGLMCLPAMVMLLPSRLHFRIKLFVQLVSVHFMKGTGTLLKLVVIPTGSQTHEQTSTPREPFDIVHTTV